MSLDKIFDLAAGVYFYFYNMVYMMYTIYMAICPIVNGELPKDADFFFSCSAFFSLMMRMPPNFFRATTPLRAVRGSWCLQVHQASSLMREYYCCARYPRGPWDRNSRLRRPELARVVGLCVGVFPPSPHFAAVYSPPLATPAVQMLPVLGSKSKCSRGEIPGVSGVLCEY